MIRDGATLVESIEHILEALRGWHAQAPVAAESGMPTAARHPLLDLLHAAPHSSEALAAASGWSLSEVLAALTELELEGRVASEGGRWVGRAS
ncbi:DprA winged helix domain protein [compost metagenome]